MTNGDPSGIHRVHAHDDGFTATLTFTLADDASPGYMMFQIAGAESGCARGDGDGVYAERDGQAQGGYGLLRSITRVGNEVRLMLTETGAATLGLANELHRVKLSSADMDHPALEAALHRLSERLAA